MKKSDISEKLVLEVNKRLHNKAARTYIGTPPYFKPTAIKKWNEVAADFLSKGSLNILDFGSGTGFVPEIILPHLQHSKLFCMDLSKNSLRLSKSRLNKYKRLMKRKKIKIKFLTNSPAIPLRIPLLSQSMDIVIVNFVLHHLYNPKVFLDEAHRILKNKGMLIIGFEPNALFLKNKVLSFTNILSQCLLCPFKPGIIIKSISQMPIMYRPKSFIKRTFLKRKYFKDNKIEKDLNRYFLKNKLIKSPLSLDDFLVISNYQSVINPNILSNKGQFTRIMFETYVHLPFLSAEIQNEKFKNMVANLNVCLKKKFPDSGYFFFSILKKQR